MTKSEEDLPFDKARSVALKSLSLKKNGASETAKPFLDDEMIKGLIDIASQAKFDDSSLVMKQKIRKLIKSRIRRDTE
jgi:hypothetical protein